MPPSLTLILYKVINIHVKYEGEHISLEGDVVIILVIRLSELHCFLKGLTLGIERSESGWHILHTGSQFAW